MTEKRWPSSADRGVTTRRALALLLLGGAVSSLGFAPLSWWPLTLLGLVVWIHQLSMARTLRTAAFRGWVFGAGHFIVGLNWIATAFTFQQNMPSWIGWIAVIVLSLYLAAFPALSGAIAWRTSRQRPFAFVFVLAAAWMLTEWLRATLLTGFAWNPLAAVWLGIPWVAAAGAWIGTYGLSGLLLLVAGVLWVGLQRNLRATAGTAVVLMVAVLAVGHSVGTFETGMPASGQSSASGGPSSAADGPSGIPIHVVQPNIAQDEKYDPHETERNTERYADLSGKTDAAPRLLLWPEGATLRFFDIEPEARLEVAGLLGPQDLLITGGPSVVLDMHGNDDIYHNSVFAIDRGASVRWRYDKAHLVPFGEYLPLRQILGQIGVSRLVPGDGDFSFGPGPRSFPLPGFTYHGAPASVGVQICYEIIFSGHVVDEAHRPTFLFNPSNDAWFGAWGPPQHLAQAQLRAIEEGIPIVRATTNGISAVINASGQLVAALGGHRKDVIDAVVPQPHPPTVFSKLGLWASALFGLLLAAAGATLRLLPVRGEPALQHADAR